MKRATNSTAVGMKKPAKIAIAVTALVLLAAIIFGVIWTSLDHSYRYDQVDLTQFFADGKNPIDFDTIKTLPVRLETTVTEDSAPAQIKTNLSNLPSFDSFKKKGPESVIDSKVPYNDTVYLYYEVYLPADDESGKEKLLASNTNYHDETKATVVHLGDKTLNEAIETWLLNYKLDAVNGHDYTTVDRYTHTETSDPVDIIEGYTLVISVKGSYMLPTTKDGVTTDVKTVYLDLTDYHWQKTAKEGAYYQGKADLLTADTVVGSTVKKMDAKVITAVNEAAKALAKLGDKTTIEFKKSENNGVTIDTNTQTTYDATFEVELTGMFLAERKVATIPFKSGDENSPFKGMKFTYKDENGDSKDITDKDIKICLTVESLVRLDEETVTALNKDITVNDADINADNKGEIATARDVAYANAYIKHVHDDLMNKAIETVKKNEASYLETLRSALFAKIVKTYSGKDIITALPEEEVEYYYNSLMVNHNYLYTNYYKAAYGSLEEYILRGVYEEDSSVSSLDKASQQKKVKELIDADIRKVIEEKIILFTLAKEYGITVTDKEWKDAKEAYRIEREAYYLKQYKSQYGTTYSIGEIQLLAADDAKTEANAKADNAYREEVTLKKVLAVLIPKLADYPADQITWTLKGQAAEEE